MFEEVSYQETWDSGAGDWTVSNANIVWGAAYGDGGSSGGWKWPATSAGGGPATTEGYIGLELVTWEDLGVPKGAIVKYVKIDSNYRYRLDGLSPSSPCTTGRLTIYYGAYVITPRWFPLISSSTDTGWLTADALKTQDFVPRLYGASDTVISIRIPSKATVGASLGTAAVYVDTLTIVIGFVRQRKHIFID